MPVDTSIYAQQQTFDPITRINNLLGVQQNALALKAAKQQFQSREALGEAYGQAIDPESGDIDTNKLISSVGRDPRLAWQAESIVQNVLARQKAQADVQKQRLEIAMQSNQAMNGLIANLANKQNVSDEDIQGTLSDAVQRGYITPSQAAQQLKTVPQDPAARKDWLRGHLLENMQAGERMAALYGQVQMVNTGQQQIPIAVSPMTGTRQVGPAFQNQAGPESLLPYQGMTQAQRADVALRGAQPITLPTPEGGQQVVTTGALAGTGGVGQTPGGIVPIAQGPSPGQVKAQEVAGEGSAKALQTLRDQAAQSGEQLFVLNQASRALDAGVKTGVGRDTINNTVNFLNANLGLSIDPEGVKNFEELKKYLVQNAIRESGSMGAGTDSKLAAAFSGNPNTSLSTLTNKEILEANKGLLKYRQAMAIAAQQSGIPPDQFSSWQTQFVKNTPVEAFVWSGMSEKQRRAYADKLTDKQRDTFKQSLQWAQQNGLY